MFVSSGHRPAVGQLLDPGLTGACGNRLASGTSWSASYTLA